MKKEEEEILTLTIALVIITRHFVIKKQIKCHTGFNASRY
jgi:hypothetical protein